MVENKVKILKKIISQVSGELRRLMLKLKIL